MSKNKFSGVISVCKKRATNMLEMINESAGNKQRMSQNMGKTEKEIACARNVQRVDNECEIGVCQ